MNLYHHVTAFYCVVMLVLAGVLMSVAHPAGGLTFLIAFSCSLAYMTGAYNPDGF